MSIDITKLRELLSDATPGQWRQGNDQVVARVESELFGEGRCAYCDTTEPSWVGTRRGENVVVHVHTFLMAWRKRDIYAERDDGNVAVADTCDDIEEADSNLIVAAVNALPELLDACEALVRVKAAHRPVEVELSVTICEGCSTWRGSGETLRALPYVEWPCPTIRAIRGEV